MIVIMVCFLLRCGVLNDIYFLVLKCDKNSFKFFVIVLDYLVLKYVCIKCLCVSFCWLLGNLVLIKY